ncbi:MAG: M20/M25/M40 family metallo-hydrolase, partial [Saprospiraceae bacterium]|nr:M20/M25/M40 family metallo-hydrolase [Saprospiraceae bacterium]
WTGDAVRTIIPDVALAEIDVRLVPESDGERLMQSIRRFIQDQGYHLVEGNPTDHERSTYPKLAAFDYEVGYAAYRTDFDAPIGGWLHQALTRALGTPPLLMRTTGGSQPISPFITALGLPAVSVRIPNPDNNIHSPNENLRLGNFLEGIATCVGILTEPIKP